MHPRILGRNSQTPATLQQMKPIDFPVFPFLITNFQISPSIELRKAPPESNPGQPPGLRTALHQTNVGGTGSSPQLKYLGETTLIYPFQCLPKRIKHIPGNHGSTYSLQQILFANLIIKMPTRLIIRKNPNPPLFHSIQKRTCHQHIPVIMVGKMPHKYITTFQLIDYIITISIHQLIRNPMLLTIFYPSITERSRPMMYPYFHFSNKFFKLVINKSRCASQRIIFNLINKFFRLKKEGSKCLINNPIRYLFE